MSRETTIEQELERKGNCFVQTTGVSMEPLLHERYSTVVLEPLSGLPKRNDVVLYHCPDGPYVIHRVRKVREHDCIIRGDNCVRAETVPHEWLVGIMTGFYNGEKYTACGDGAYRRYVRTVGPRWMFRCSRAFLGRVWRKVRGK